MEGYESYGNGDFECADGNIIEFTWQTMDTKIGTVVLMVDMNNDNKTDNYFGRWWFNGPNGCCQ